MNQIKQEELIFLLHNYIFISDAVRDKIISDMNLELSGLSSQKQDYILRKMFNIYSIAGKFHCEQVFTNGRITFKDDNELVFSALVGDHNSSNEVVLFSGCTIARGECSTYILLKNSALNYHEKTNLHSFDFQKFVLDAISPPEISIVVNTGYYPAMIENILVDLK